MKPRGQPSSGARVPAPALARGLALLDHLGSTGPAGLETLAAALGYPKASVFRLLETLRRGGHVEKLDSGGYRARTLLRREGEDEGFDVRLAARLERLCRDTGRTTEWYLPEPEGLRLVRQWQPDADVAVRARPGFLRRWDGELDSVAMLGHAFWSKAPPAIGAKTYVSDGVLGRLSKSGVLQAVARARALATTSDPAWNKNGVRRHAAAVFEGRRFRGVAAIAETFHFPSSPTHSPEHLRALLADIAPPTKKHP